MRLELEIAHAEPLRWEESLTLEDEALRSAGVRVLGEVACRGTVFHSAPDYIVRGEVSYRQRLQCFRCMEGFEEPVEGEFDLVAQVQGRTLPGDEIELDESDLDVVALEHPWLDTEVVVVEHIQLQLPMKPLCQSDCRGLCASCGGNLNRSDCSCDAASDSPFSALAELKAKLEDKG